jgi:hypothetical protein
MSGRSGTGAMPEGHDAIRVRFDEHEPPAVMFNERARPGALVSWAWCQLSALDSLLRPLVDRRRPGDADVAGAVRSVLVPVINALVLSEQRAHELESRRPAPTGRKRRGKRARRAAN